MTVRFFNYLPQDAMIIRTKVFVDEQGFCDDGDSVDGIATHILVYCGEQAVGVCRVFTAEEPGVYFLGRFCILKEYRGKNIGSFMLSEAEKFVLSQGGKAMHLHSQYQSKGFYEKAGYCAFGDIEYEQGKAHIQMKKTL